jgi:hypothetical protein
MTTCDRVRDALLDAALGAAAGPEVAAHLDGCAECRARLADERLRTDVIDAELRAGLDVSPSPAFAAGVRRRMAETPLRQPWKLFVPVALAAGLAVVVLLGLRAENRGAPAPSMRIADQRPATGPSVAPPRPPSVARATLASPERLAARRPRPRLARPPAPAVLVPAQDERALRLFLERVQAELDDDLGQALRVSDAADAPILPMTELPPMVIPPLTRSDS